MCVLTIKPDKMLNLFRAKSWIDVLGNHEDCIWSKSERYAPVLCSDTMHLIFSMALEHCCTLKQGDCKNAFCQGILPPDKIMIVKPPIGDPQATKDGYWLLKRTLYGLCHSPWQLYMKIKSILNQLGLHQNAYIPCLFTGSIVDPSNPADTPSSAPLTLDLYVDDFVYFSEGPAVNTKFQHLLNNLISVEVMGTVKWFLMVSHLRRSTNSPKSNRFCCPFSQRKQRPYA
jgi:hypothetical protein